MGVCDLQRKEHGAHAGGIGESKKENTNVTQREPRQQLFTAFPSSQREFCSKQTHSHISSVVKKKTKTILNRLVFKCLLFHWTRTPVVHTSWQQKQREESCHLFLPEVLHSHPIFKNIRALATSVCSSVERCTHKDLKSVFSVSPGWPAEFHSNRCTRNSLLRNESLNTCVLWVLETITRLSFTYSGKENSFVLKHALFLCIPEHECMCTYSRMYAITFFPSFFSQEFISLVHNGMTLTSTPPTPPALSHKRINKTMQTKVVYPWSAALRPGKHGALPFSKNTIWMLIPGGAETHSALFLSGSARRVSSR